MMISVQAIALWGSVVVTLALLAASLSIGWDALSRLSALGTRLDAVGERLDAAAAALSDELGTLSTVNEAQSRQLQILAARLERLGADIVRREAWECEPKPRHAAVLEAIRHGDGADALTREHGLSSSEVELLLLLHGEDASTVGGVS